jgi:hypothetical protein
LLKNAKSGFGKRRLIRQSLFGKLGPIDWFVLDWINDDNASFETFTPKCGRGHRSSRPCADEKEGPFIATPWAHRWPRACGRLSRKIDKNVLTLDANRVCL